MKTIICSHGFGVRADSRGMFTDIAAAFPGCEFKMFDYDDVKPNGDMVMRSLPERAKLLQEQIDAVDGEIVLVCHSLGCIIPGLVDLTRVSKVILLAPPVRTSEQRFADMLKQREGSEFNPDGLSVLPRSDGSMMYLPKEFIESVDTTDPMEMYQKIADTKLTVIIRAKNDELLGLTNVNEIKNAQIIDMDSDHNFTGTNREVLIDMLRSEF